MSLGRLLVTDPKKWEKELKLHHKPLSYSMAEELDEQDPISHTAQWFESVKTAMAGHSLGPKFTPTVKKLNEAADLQRDLLHGVHFKETHPDGKNSGHSFGCSRQKLALQAAKEILGFEDDCEFDFNGMGLTQNLAMLIRTFLKLRKKDWEQRKVNMLMLSTDFISDQAIAYTAMADAIATAEGDECFEKAHRPKGPDENIFKVEPDENGLYRTEDIVNAILKNADKLKMIILPDIVFGTGQRLQLDEIFRRTRDAIVKNNIIVILDLAHGVGNRPIDLKSMPVTAAVGCAYKHLSQGEGDSFGVYVNRLAKFLSIQGWLALNPNRAFAEIDSFKPDQMEKKGGALDFRLGNTAPRHVLPVQTYLIKFNEVGFKRCFAKSECLTRYLIMQLQHHLKDKIDIVTPLDPDQRGATIAIRFKKELNLDVKKVAEKLMQAGVEVDTRRDVMRITAHYGYTKFTDVFQFVHALKRIVENKPSFFNSPYRNMALVGLAGLAGFAAMTLFGAGRSKGAVVDSPASSFVPKP